MKKLVVLLAAMAACVTAGAWNYRNFVVDAVQYIEKGRKSPSRCACPIMWDRESISW